MNATIRTVARFPGRCRRSLAARAGRGVALLALGALLVSACAPAYMARSVGA